MTSSSAIGLTTLTVDAMDSPPCSESQLLPKGVTLKRSASLGD